METAAPAGGELFTRGGPNVPDQRGLSMVARHQEKLQQEKERRGMEKLRALMPHLSPAVHAMALEKLEWDEERALIALRKFSATKAEELKALQKERKRHEARLLKSREKLRRDKDEESTTGSDTGSESGSEGSDSDSEDDRRRSKKRSRSKSEKKDRKESRRSKKRSKKDDGKKRRKEKDRDRDRDSKKRRKDSRDKDRGRDKDKATAKNIHVVQEYGKYGIIRETDLYSKRPEFMLWAAEVKGADVEAMPRFEEKELFKSYMEDYNTGTLPHKKYYDLETYERQQAARGAAAGGRGGGEKVVFDDEAERRRELAVERQREKEARLKAAYEELQTTDKAEAMRQQDLLRQKMALAYRTGDVKEAQRLAERLRPDDMKPASALPPREPAQGT